MSKFIAQVIELNGESIKSSMRSYTNKRAMAAAAIDAASWETTANGDRCIVAVSNERKLIKHFEVTTTLTVQETVREVHREA